MSVLPNNRTKLTLVCKTCGAKARRMLSQWTGRGPCEAATEPAYCPNGHGPMAREDGGLTNAPVANDAAERSNR